MTWWRERWRVARLWWAFFWLAFAFGMVLPRKPTDEQRAETLRKGQEMFRRAAEIGHISEWAAAAEIRRLQLQIDALTGNP